MLKKVFYRYFESFTKILFDCIFLGCNCYCCTICPFLYLHEVLNHWLNVCLETASLFHSSKCPYKCNRYPNCESQVKLANFSSALPTLPTTLRVLSVASMSTLNMIFTVSGKMRRSLQPCVFFIISMYVWVCHIWHVYLGCTFPLALESKLCSKFWHGI